MDIEILQTLKEIRGILYALSAFISVALFVLIIRWIGNIVTSFKSAWENDFVNRANNHFQRNELANLDQLCQEKLQKYPNHSTAVWWLARSKLEQGNSVEASELFKRLVELEPTWKESHVEPYLKKLSEG